MLIVTKVSQGMFCLPLRVVVIESERVWSGGARVKKWKSEKPDTASGQRVKTVASVWSCLAKANFIINEDVSSKLVFILIHKFIVTKLNSTSTSHISIMTQANTPPHSHP